MGNFHSVRGELLSQLGRPAEAQIELERAASLARNKQERRLTQQRAVAMAYTCTRMVEPR